MESQAQTVDTPLKEQLAKLKILLAEDSLVNQKVILSQLKHLGGAADVVGDGQAVLNSLSTTHYDIVLMDCQMPKMDGYSATRGIRALETTRRTVVIAMTADLDQGDWLKCIEAGMDDYLNKPVRSDELAAKLVYWSEHLASANHEHPQSSLVFSSDLSAGAPQESLTSLIDWDYLHELSDGNEAFELELLETLMGATLPHLESLRTNIAIADFKKIEQEAHYLKGSTASIGAKELEALAARLEEQAQDQQIEDMDDLMLKIEQGFSQLRALITMMNP